MIKNRLGPDTPISRGPGAEVERHILPEPHNPSIEEHETVAAGLPVRVEGDDGLWYDALALPSLNESGQPIIKFELVPSEEEIQFDPDRLIDEILGGEPPKEFGSPIGKLAVGSFSAGEIFDGDRTRGIIPSNVTAIANIKKARSGRTRPVIDSFTYPEAS